MNNITSFGYILMVALPLIIILIYRLYLKDNLKQGPSDEAIDHILRNGMTIHQLNTVYDALMGYRQLLQSYMPESLPEVREEIREIAARIRFLRCLTNLLNKIEPNKEITTTEWKGILLTAAWTAKSQFSISPEELDRYTREANEQIKNLKRQGLLPEDYPNTDQQSDTDD